MFDRRAAIRKPIRVLFNKYIHGYPHLCESLDLSESGLLARAFGEPRDLLQSFTMELKLPGETSSAWVWARGVWRHGRSQAFEFVTSAEERARITRYLAVA
ncbi:MAG: PilZ domain-containing protein [Polyangiaceae bacterium]